jgi:hypothetical protein
VKMVRDFERKLAAAALARDPELSRLYDTRQLTLEGLDELRDPPRATPLRTVPDHPGPATGPVRVPAMDGPGRSPRAPTGPDRTELLVNQGRGSAYRPSRWRQRKFLIGAGAALLVVIIVVVTIVLSSGASWPASFACAKQTQQVLWVFSLLSSENNPQFNDAKTGRQGLEPITPTQGAEVAWSLNLHHPYNPLNPIDSLQVAARAIDNIIGGASAIGANGAPSIQPGLESYPANCLRYTGSAELTSRAGFPSVCAKPIKTSQQEGALVADVYKKWAVGATAQQANAAEVLFENSGNPGSQQVQAILKNLSKTRL